MRSLIIAAAAYAAFMLLVGLCGYASQKVHNHRAEQCFKFDDAQQRYACLRRV